MKKPLIVTFFIIFIFLSAALTAAAEETVIRSIQFTGLKRTRESTAFQIIRPVDRGTPFTPETEEFLIQKLREAEIFNPEITVNTEIDGNLADIEIILKDRWTLIPIPVFSIDQNGEWRAGVLAIESNILGFNKTLGLGFFFGSEGWSFLNFYADDAFLGSRFELTSSINLGLNETTDQQADESVLRSWKSDEIRLGLGLAYPLTEELSLSGGWGYDRSIARKSTIPDLNSTGVSTGLKWEKIYYDIPYEYGLMARADYGWNLGISDTENYQKLTSSVKWGIRPFGRQLLQLRAEAGMMEKAPVQNQFRLGGKPGTLTLPGGKIGADEYASAFLAWNTPLWTFNAGTISARAFYEGGYFASNLIERELYHGPGGGLEFFINDLAIPAIQMTIAWNLETGIWQFTAGVGMGGNPD
ncbi:MAG: hypothetical protein PQJ50_16350 [Spirochaetales bacterium]|nr:hypothetical protein [Spirochaetales bacterium]